MSLPRTTHGSVSEVAFPQPLRPSDVALLRRIFAFQARGDIPGANTAAAALQDKLLLGTVLADRYLGRFHRSTAGELSEWLAQYIDLPDAAAIHALLLTRLPKNAKPPAAPAASSGQRAADDSRLPEDIDPPRSDLVRNAVLDRTVADRAQHGDAGLALRMIAAARGLSPAYAAQLRAEVAQALFTRNEDVEALRIAEAVLTGTAAADQPGLAFYVGGLSAWRLDRIDRAKSLFEGGARAVRSPDRLHAASAFWASRVSRVLHDVDGAANWLRVAAEERLTFHGLLARRILRMDVGIVPSRELLAQADVDAVAETPAGRRAIALLQIGQSNRAAAELQGLWPQARVSPVFGRALLMVAAAAGLEDCAAQMAAMLQSQDGRQHHEELRFPMPRLQPAGGFSVEPALVYALTRLESNFDSGAISPVGARGLMQIMPSTAQYITGDTFYAPERLHEPASNLAIGQRYIAYLSRQDGIDNDLIRVLASYNCGPGSLSRWGPLIHDHGDPLLFIEAIPVAETRAFVTHALVYSWIYAARMHQPAASLDDLSTGVFPRFTPNVQRRRMALLTPG